MSRKSRVLAKVNPLYKSTNYVTSSGVVVYITGIWYNNVKSAKELDVVRKKTERKTEDTKSQEYELVYILTPEMSDEALENRVNNITQLITGKDGTIIGVDKWGKKKLAYPIKHFLEGNYILTKFTLSPTRCKELEANLRISEDIVRHLLINVGS